MEKKWWKRRKANEQAWKVPVEQIRDSGYNLDIKNPHDADTGPGDPDELLKQYKTVLADLGKTRDALKEELMSALGESREGAKARTSAFNP